MLSCGRARSASYIQAASTVPKKLGLTLVSEKTGEERVYRIVAKDVAPKRKSRSGRKAA